MDNGIDLQELGVRRRKSPELRRRNRKVGWVVVIVALILLIGSGIYIAEWGGTNKGGAKPFWMNQGGE